MAYNSKEIWIPCDKQGQARDEGESTGYEPVQSGGLGGLPVPDGDSNIPRGLCYGYHLKVSATDSSNTAVPVKLFDVASGDEIYSTTANMTTLTQVVDTLATPIPCFETPYFRIGPIQAGAAAGITYTIRFFKALA